MKIYPYVDTTRANKDGLYPVYFIISRAKRRFFVNTGIVTSDKLDGFTFPKSDKNWRRKTTLLGSYYADVESLCLMGGMDEMSDALLKEAIQTEIFGKQQKDKTLLLSDCIKKFAAEKKDSTRAIYNLTARKVEAFDRKATLSVGCEWLDAFSKFYTREGMGINGVGKELRNIRAVFNWARRKKMTDNYPFLDYKITSEETIPNNISVEQLRLLRDYQCENWQKPYVDFFFLSFYLAGINPVDLLMLKREDMKDGHVSFVRTKTNKQGAAVIRRVTLPILPEAKAIIESYPSNEGWLVGFMDCRNSYRSFTRQANEALQKVGPWRKVKDKVGKLRKIEVDAICPDITLYSARYTFASIAANDLDMSERTIGMCLGHSWSKNVTARYMAVDQRKVDNAVRRVVGFLREGKTSLKDY